mgnify:FL=1
MLKNMIDIDANLFHSILYQKGVLSVQDLEKITNYREPYIHLVLGWLLKDNRIHFLEKEDNLYIGLNT